VKTVGHLKNTTVSLQSFIFIEYRILNARSIVVSYVVQSARSQIRKKLFFIIPLLMNLCASFPSIHPAKKLKKEK
jgi:hypothetical protein